MRTPYSASTTRVCSPTPHSRRIGSGARNAASSPGGTIDEPVGLAQVGGHLGDELGRRHPDARREADLAAHRLADLPGDRLRGTEEGLAAGHVEERLVDRDLLEQRREPPEDLHDAPALAAVLRAVDGEEGAARAERGRRPERHRGMDAEGTGLVAGSRHHAPGPRVAPDDDRAAAQLGPVALLHRREERVEVDVEDRGAASHPPIIAAT